uniref:Uncharacterized protein n=1 Tax=Oryza punctata TaxID=4537 RepID=A0A0E0JZ50_ORYPU
MDAKLQDAVVAHEDMDAEVAPEDDMTTCGIVEHLVQEDNSADTMEVEQLAQVCIRCG